MDVTDTAPYVHTQLYTHVLCTLEVSGVVGGLKAAPSYCTDTHTHTHAHSHITPLFIQVVRSSHYFTLVHSGSHRTSRTIHPTGTLFSSSVITVVTNNIDPPDVHLQINEQHSAYHTRITQDSKLECHTCNAFCAMQSRGTLDLWLHAVVQRVSLFEFRCYYICYLVLSLLQHYKLRCLRIQCCSI